MLSVVKGRKAKLYGKIKWYSFPDGDILFLDFSKPRIYLESRVQWHSSGTACTADAEMSRRKVLLENSSFSKFRG
jgi:hypothetical protein